MRDAPPRPVPLQQCPAHAAQSIPLHQVQNLMQGGTTAHIDLNGQIYTLRVTRAGKLILTK